MNFSFAGALAEDVLAEAKVLAAIEATLDRARGVIQESDRYFRSVRDADARRWFPEPAGLPPAYALFGEGVFFTSAFAPFDPTTGRGFGPLCRAAMVVHESVHVVDAASGAPAVHVSEWQEPAFSAQTTEESLHNPSAYASMVAQLHERALDWPVAVRYGAGRPRD